MIAFHNIAAIRGGQTVTQKRTGRLMAISPNPDFPLRTPLQSDDNAAML